jgi:electron transfer flavoprotein beta subunit
MKITLCVKAVSSKLVYSNEVRDEGFTLNPYDLFALEKLLELKKRMDISITCICMGALAAKSVLIHCLAMGADEAVLVSDKKFAGADTYATVYTLHKALQKLNFDAVVCGAQAVDGETGQVSYGLAQRLNMLCIPNVMEIESASVDHMTVETKTPDCIRSLLLKLPAVISFGDFVTDSGKISLISLKRAQKKQLEIWNSEILGIDAEMCGQTGSKTKVIKTASVLNRRNTYFCEGTDEEKSGFLLEKLLASS